MVNQNDQQNGQPNGNGQPLGNDQPNGNDQPPDQPDAALAVNRIQVKVPPFWKQNPQLWFRQLEAQFSNSNIRSDLTKYNTVVGVVESDILTCVSDIVLNPPANDMYEAIKTRLINRFEETENKKLKNLLNDLSLGDMRPSDLLLKMRELSCNKVGEDLLRTLWLQRLPLTIQTVLSTSTDTLAQLSIMADTMFEVSEAPTVAAVNSAPVNQLNDLVNVVYKLDGKIESLKKSFRESSKGTRRNHEIVPQRPIERRLL